MGQRMSNASDVQTVKHRVAFKRGESKWGG